MATNNIAPTAMLLEFKRRITVSQERQFTWPLAHKDSTCVRILHIFPCGAGARFLVHFSPPSLDPLHQRGFPPDIRMLLNNQPDWHGSNATVPCFPYTPEQVCVCFCFVSQLNSTTCDAMFGLQSQLRFDYTLRSTIYLHVLAQHLSSTVPFLRVVNEAEYRF